MILALFGIENDGLNLAVNLLVFFLVVIWLALVYWTYSDARRRIDDPMLVACATAASLFPFIGTVVYTIVRPPEFLDDAHERQLEIQAAEARVRVLESRTCRNCGTAVEPSFLRCPTCLRRLREPCRSCGKPLDPRWKICPYCETETREGALAAGARTQRRRNAEARKEARRGEAPPVDAPETGATRALPPRRSAAPPPTERSGSPDGAPPGPRPAPARERPR
jgi:hypothetical protein